MAKQLKNISLRDYQSRDVDRLRQAYRSGFRAPLYVLSTGGGKTIIFSYIARQAAARGNRVLILVHRQELLRQSSDSLEALGVDHGLVAPGRSYSGDRVQVASVQTLVRRLGKVPAPDLIIVDECFPAGTLVDGAPIEHVQAGDVVSSFNHWSGEVEPRRVVRTFKSRPSSMVTVSMADGTKIACTSGHPFFLNGRGYVPAIKLSGGDYVCKLHLVREGIRNHNKAEARPTEGNGKGLLFSGVRKSLPLQGVIGNNGKNEPEIRIGSHEKEQPDEKTFSTGENVQNFKGDWPQAKGQGRERSWSDGVSGGPIFKDCEKKSTSCDRACRADENSKGVRIPSMLQNRHCNPCGNGSCGGRRVLPLFSGAQVAGCKERGIFDLVRVDRVEIHEPGDSRGFDGLLPDGFVYNIEVEGNHNYFADGILVHNCHHASASSWRKIIQSYPTAKLLGVTATPIRMDGKGLGTSAGGFFDTMIEGPSIRDLIAGEYLCPPRVYAPPTDFSAEGLRSKFGDFVQKEIAAAVDKPVITGSAVDHYRKICAGTPAITFCASVAHAEHVAAEFRAAGFRAASVDGTMDDGRRKSLINALGSGGLHVLTSCDIISEGTDIPVVGAAILLRPTQSTGLFLQQIGRALRVCPGKKHAIILDHVGNCLRHGMPDEVRTWSLDGEDRKAASKKPQTVLERVKQCEKCYSVHPPAPVCPFCGFVYEGGRELEQVDGELAEITEEQAEFMRRQRKREIGRAQTLEDLQAIARERGYKPGWAKIIWNARKGRRAGMTANA